MMRRGFLQQIFGVGAVSKIPISDGVGRVGVCSCGAKMTDKGCLATGRGDPWFVATIGEFPDIRVWWCETCGNLRAWRTEAKN